MRFRMLAAIAGVAGLTGAGGAAAQPHEIGYPKGSLAIDAIAKADYAAAERQLQDFRVPKNDPGRLINFGVVLAKTGRTEAAARQFQQVLEEDEVELIVADGRTMSSHAIARAALRRLSSGN